MSAIGRPFYTAQATIWPLIGKSTDGYNKSIYGLPVTFACDYGTEKKINRYKDDTNVEFTAKLTIWHEDYPDAKRGDYVAIGAFTESSPLDVEDADEVRTILNYGNTLDRNDIPDYAIITG